MGWQAVAGLSGLAIIALALVRDYRRRLAARQQAERDLFAPLLRLSADARMVAVETAGSQCLRATVDGQTVEVRTVTDTLALRKLPSLWLMVTLPGRTGAEAALDLMMRPAAQTSFSNFDHLPDTLPRPAGFPEEAVLKSDDERRAPSPDLFRPFLRPFFQGYGKELLLTPKGVRFVMQLAEGDRARYGVFRQADFSPPPLSPELIRPIIVDLAALKDSLAGASAAATEERIAIRA